MDLLQPGKIRVYLKDGTIYDCPESNKLNVVRCVVPTRIDHYKPPKAAVPPKVAAPKSTEKTKASLLGDLLKDNKISAAELVTWLEDSKDIGDIGIVMKGEGRATPKAAAKKRLTELI